MPNQQIFCNVPWTNLHIYWDGSFGACCSENGKPYSNARYNLDQLTVQQWFNSAPMQALRKNILADEKLSLCIGCYSEERIGHESRRIKENFKSVIFTERAFQDSYEQSPMRAVFEQTKVDIVPIDWHVDLGNECNLACKMCNPGASSKIAAQYRQWNIIPANTGIFANWTENPAAWSNFVASVKETPNLNRVHFMGGEPLLNKKFNDILDVLLEYTPGTSVSFVTNGTLYDSEIIEKLKKFSSCDIEVSVESFDRTNDYIRQGSRINSVLDNLAKFQANITDNFRVILRSVPQLLNINSYYHYLRYCWQNRIIVQSIPLKTPEYLQISVLPDDIKRTLLVEYRKLETELQAQTNKEFVSIATGRDESKITAQILRETCAMISLLEQPTVREQLRFDLINWLTKWDSVHKLNALEFYPEYADFFKKYGYKI